MFPLFILYLISKPIIMKNLELKNLKPNFVLLLLLFISGLSIFYYSCTKDDYFTPEFTNENTSISLRHSDGDNFTPSDSIKEIILGPKAPCNPYTVEIVTQAWNNIYPDYTINRMPLSDRYVKFTPANQEEIYNLYKEPDITVWDYPLDHEVVQMGDFYNQPGKSENDLPDLYSVVNKDYDFNLGVAYEELAQLVEVPYNSLLSAEAYRICNLPHIVVYPPSDPPPDDEPPVYYPPIDFDNCKKGCPNYPCCFIKNVDCEGPIHPIEEEICNNFDPDCLPDDPGFPDCLNFDGGGGTSTTYTNSCGCTRYSDKRKPAGCVKVQTPTSNDFLGVNNAKIIIRNTSCYDCPDINYIFGSLWTKTTQTDEYGCWKINKSCRGKIWMWVQFKNEKTYVRGNNFYIYVSGTDTYTGLPEFGIDGNILNYIRPVTDYIGSISGPNFSNIQVNFSRWTEERTQTQRYWCAAQTINNVEDMHEMCNQENINVPPHMDIYMASDVTGAAWMAHYGGVSNIIYAQLLDAFFPGASISILPDIFLDRNEDPDNYSGTAFHEMSHASHFTNIGSAWWQHNTQFQFEHGGHGDAAAEFDLDAGYVAVSESWGDHLGDLFDQGNPPTSTINERLVNEVNGWVPEGIHYDLFDSGMGLEPPWPNGGGVIDNVSGFTNAMIFDILDANTTTIPEMRQRLWDKYSTAPGVMATEADYILLFNEY